MSAPNNNRNAAKPRQERASALLRVRCRAGQKSAYQRAAHGKLSPWILAALDRAAAEKSCAVGTDEAK